jgi:hypothetical protein
MTIVKRKFRKMGVAMIRAQEQRAYQYLKMQGYDIEKIKKEL